MGRGSGAGGGGEEGGEREEVEEEEVEDIQKNEGEENAPKLKAFLLLRHLHPLSLNERDEGGGEEEERKEEEEKVREAKGRGMPHGHRSDLKGKKES